MNEPPEGGIRMPRPYTRRKMGFGEKKQADRIRLADLTREAPRSAL